MFQTEDNSQMNHLAHTHVHVFSGVTFQPKTFIFCIWWCEWKGVGCLLTTTVTPQAFFGIKPLKPRTWHRKAVFQAEMLSGCVISHKASRRERGQQWKQIAMSFRGSLKFEMSKDAAILILPLESSSDRQKHEEKLDYFCKLKEIGLLLIRLNFWSIIWILFFCVSVLSPCIKF